MELINRMRKNRKGFTLVEIIVVLVILAILAAFTIPTMLGFVNDAKGKSYIAEAREVYVAAQATSTEMTAKGGLTSTELATALGSSAVKSEKDTPATGAAINEKTKTSRQMVTYLNEDITPIAAQADTKTSAGITAGNAHWTITMDATNGAKVSTLVYSKGGYEVTISGGNATVKKI